MTDSTQEAAAQDTTTSAAGEVQSVAPVAESAAPAAEPVTGADGGDTTATDFADFALPEGVEINAEVLTQFKGIAKELGISQEAAQKLIDLQASMETNRAEATQLALAEQAKQWAEAIKADKELGGEKFAATQESAVKAIERFGSPELRSLLNDTGLGNHPELVKFCHRIGAAISEDGLVLGGTQTGAKEMSLVDAFS